MSPAGNGNGFQPGFEQLDTADLERERDAALRDWLKGAIAREVPRLNRPEEPSDRDWLKNYGLRDSDWLITAKAQFKAGMRPTCALKDRIWSCLVLHGPGYRGELVVKLVGNKRVAFTSRDLLKGLNQAADEWASLAGLNLDVQQKKQFHVSKQHVRRGLASLESEGRAIRALQNGLLLRDLSLDQRKGLQEGDILLFCLFRPVQPDPRAVATYWLPDFAPSSPLVKASRSLKLLRLRLDPRAVAINSYLSEELESAADDYRKAETVARKTAQTRVMIAAASPHIENKVLESKSLKVSECAGTHRATAQGNSKKESLTHSNGADSDEKAKTEIALQIATLTGQRPRHEDPVFRAIASYPLEHGITVAHFCQFLEAKHREKVQKRYPITSFAFFKTVCDDFPLWWGQHQGQVPRAKEHSNHRVTEPPYSVDELRSHIQACARAIRQRPQSVFAEVVSALEGIIERIDDHGRDLTQLEAILSDLEDRMSPSLLEILSDENLSAIHQAVEAELEPYVEQMTAEQLQKLKRRYIHAALFAQAKLPRLSLYYVGSAKSAAGGA